MIERISDAAAVPSDQDAPLAAIERSILAAERRRSQQLAYIAILDGFGAPKVHALRVLDEIDTALRRSREHFNLLKEMSNSDRSENSKS